MIFQELIKTAHIGTERISFDIEKFLNEEEQILQVLKNVSYKNSEDKLLNYSAIMTIYNKSGNKPLKLDKTPEIVRFDIDERKTVKISEYLLNSIFDETNINNNYLKLQESFLEKLIKKNEIIPDSFIVKFLDFGFKVKQLRPYISLVVGKTALMISSKKEEWNYIYELASNEKDKDINSKGLTKQEDLKYQDDIFTKEIIEEIKVLIDKILLVERYKDNTFKIKLINTKSLNKSIPEKLINLFNLKEIRGNSKNVIYNIDQDIIREIAKNLPLSYWEKRFDSDSENIVKGFIDNGFQDLLIQISYRVLKEKNTEWAESLFKYEILYNNLNSLLSDDFKKEYFNKILRSLNIEDINNIKILSFSKKSGIQLSEKEKDLLKSSNNSINKYITCLTRVLAFYNSFSLDESKNIINHLIFILIAGNFNFYAFHELAYKLDPKIYPYLKEQIEKNKISFSDNIYFFKSISNILRLRYLLIKERCNAEQINERIGA